MKKTVSASLCAAAALSAGEWAKPEWLSCEKGLCRSQAHRGQWSPVSDHFTSDCPETFFALVEGFRKAL